MNKHIFLCRSENVQFISFARVSSFFLFFYIVVGIKCIREMHFSVITHVSMSLMS